MPKGLKRFLKSLVMAGGGWWLKSNIVSVPVPLGDLERLDR